VGVSVREGGNEMDAESGRRKPKSGAWYVAVAQLIYRRQAGN